MGKPGKKGPVKPHLRCGSSAKWLGATPRIHLENFASPEPPGPIAVSNK
jgi:hypothetical protein